MVSMKYLNELLMVAVNLKEDVNLMNYSGRELHFQFIDRSIYPRRERYEIKGIKHGLHLFLAKFHPIVGLKCLEFCGQGR